MAKIKKSSRQENSFDLSEKAFNELLDQFGNIDTNDQSTISKNPKTLKSILQIDENQDFNKKKAFFKKVSKLHFSDPQIAIYLDLLYLSLINAKLDSKRKKFLQRLNSRLNNLDSKVLAANEADMLVVANYVYGLA